MTRAASFGLVAVVAMLSLAGSAGGSGSAARSFRIIAMSHTHPAGQDYSLVCARIRTKTRGAKTAKVTARGDAGVIGTRTIRAKRNETRLVAFKINMPGRYTFKLKQGANTSYKSYTVPAPDPAIGPFPCV